MCKVGRDLFLDEFNGQFQLMKPPKIHEVGQTVDIIPCMYVSS